MPTSLHAPLVFIVFLWTTYFVQLYRTYHMGRLKTDIARFLWFAGFLAVFVITFSGRQTEQQLDAYVTELPIVFYTKFVCAMVIVHALYLMVRPAALRSLLKDRFCLLGSWVTILVALLTVPIFVSLHSVPQEKLRYGLIALRDLVVCAYMLGVFIPATYPLWRKETVLPTKLKHFAGLLFDVTYLILAIGNIWTFLASLSSLEAAEFTDLAFKPVMALCALFFTLTISPSRYLETLFWPQRWLLLRRLRRLEKQIIQLVGIPARELSGAGLEDRIYRTVISILDHYRKLYRRRDSALYQSINNTIRTYKDYPQLIEQLAKLV